MGNLFFKSSLTKLLPIKPAPPVTKIIFTPKILLLYLKKENKLKYLSNIAIGIFSSLEGVKNQSQKIIKSKIETNLKNLDIVNREEFEEVKSMIIKAREKNSILEAKIKALEKKLGNYKKY